MNKKSIVFIFLFLVCLETYAQFNDSRVSATVGALQTMWDDSLVVLEGYLIKRLDNEKEIIYVLKDDTGRIEVRIDYKDFKPVAVNFKTKVKLWGKVDVLWPSKDRRVNVDCVEILSSQVKKSKQDSVQDSPCNNEKRHL